MDRTPATPLPSAPLRAPGVAVASDAVLVAWFAYLLIAPTVGFGWIDAWHNEQRAVQVLLLGATGLVVVTSRALCDAIAPRGPSTVTLWALGGIGVVSSLAAPFAAAALAEVALFACLGMLAVLVAARAREHGAVLARAARRACVLLAAAYVSGTAVRYGAMLALERAPNLDVLLLGYANPRFPSALYALLMPFLAVCAADTSERVAIRRAAWFTLAMLWCIHLALGTRAVWFACALALPVLAWIAPWRNLVRPVQATIVTACTGAVLYALLFHAVPRWLGLGDALPSQAAHLASVDDRLLLWRQALAAMASHPWLGLGPMNLAGQGDAYASHPHDWILQLGAEWGLPALALLLGLLAVTALGVRRQLRASSATTQGDAIGPLAAVVVGLCYGLVDGNLVMPVSQTAFVLALGFVAGVLTERRIAPGAWRAWLSRLVLLAGAAYLVTFALLSLPLQAESEAAWRRSTRHPDMAPRFWQQGLLR